MLILAAGSVDRGSDEPSNLANGGPEATSERSEASPSTPETTGSDLLGLVDLLCTSISIVDDERQRLLDNLGTMTPEELRDLRDALEQERVECNAENRNTQKLHQTLKNGYHPFDSPNLRTLTAKRFDKHLEFMLADARFAEVEERDATLRRADPATNCGERYSQIFSAISVFRDRFYLGQRSYLIIAGLAREFTPDLELEGAVLWDTSVSAATQCEIWIDTLDTMLRELIAKRDSLRRISRDTWSYVPISSEFDPFEIIAAELIKQDRVRAEWLAECIDNLQVQADTIRAHRRSELSILNLLQRFDFAVTVKPRKLPIAVTVSTSDVISVSIGGRLAASTNEFDIGAETTINKDPSSRRLFVQDSKGTVLAYDLKDQRVHLDVTAWEYRLRYHGFDIILSLRAEF